MVELNDAVEIAGTRRTDDGYLVAEVRAARSGIQTYTGAEVDPDGSLGLRDRATVRVWRPEDEVFAEAAMRSYAYRPVTLEHPAGPVTADNWRSVSVGQTGGEVARDQDWIRVPMVLMDAAAIAAVEGGKRQLSMGYTCQLVADSGTTPDGQEYDAIQRNLKMNHLAVVSAARAGAKARIGDDHQGGSLMTDKLQKVVVDGLTIEVTDQGAQALAKVQKQLADAEAAQAKADADHQKALADKDAEIAKKDAEIDALKGKVLDGAALDAAVAKRADLIAKAKAIAPEVKTEGLADAAIRKAVVLAKLGDAVKDKADAYIDARFDILAEDAASQATLATALAAPAASVGDRAAYEKALADHNASMNAHRKSA